MGVLLQALPGVSRPADMVLLRRNTDRWGPVVHAICRRHGIDEEPAHLLGEGTNLVFALGSSTILKLFPPHWSRLAAAEAATARLLYDRMGVDTPRVRYRGSVGNWPYLIMTRVRGVPLRTVWHDMPPEDQHNVAVELGRLLARQHGLTVEGLSAVPANWSGLVQKRIQECVERRRAQGLAQEWLAQIAAFLQSAQPLHPPHFTPVVVTGDFHQYHLTVERAGGRWQLAGYFDFDDATIGFREYDLAVPGIFMMAGRPSLFRAFLLSYGYAPCQLDEGLRRRLMAYTLLHRYRDLNWLLSEYVRGARLTTLEEVTANFFSTDDRGP